MQIRSAAGSKEGGPATSQPREGAENGSGQPSSANPAPDPFRDRIAKESFSPKLPEVTLPKPGAIRGMGEKFSVAPATGTGSIAIPLPLPPARLTPQLQLSYDSGAGNGIFGFGWNVGRGGFGS